MSRAAFLPTPGDPFLLELWLKYYERWYREVDQLYVYINSPSDHKVIDEMMAMVKGKPRTICLYTNNQVEHGEVLKRLVQMAHEDHIMFIEDDGFIFKPGKVDECFRRLESGEVDIIGSKRGSCSQWLYDEASRKWGIDNSGYGDNGPNFWPNFFFAKSKHLKDVTNFASKYWKKGEKVEPLGLRATEDLASDTFVEGSLQLRMMTEKIAYEPQYHGNTDDEPDYVNKTNIWDGQAAWLHVGSLSSGYHGLLSPGHNLDNVRFDTIQEKLELERRIVFWLMALENSKNRLKAGAVYHEAIHRLVRHFGLDYPRIYQRIKMYKAVMDA